MTAAMVGGVLQRILTRLDAKRNGDQWVAKCPAHADNSPSLRITEKDRRVLLYCHAQCELNAVLTAAGLEMSDLFEDERPKSGPTEPIATYDYTDENGVLLMQVCRFPPKDGKKKFLQRKPDGKWGVKGVRVVPYRLPEVLDAPDLAPIFVVEGEKDVESLRRIGLVATCNAGGAGKWKAEHAAPLRGRDVIILPDNDDPGRNHADIVARSLTGIAASVKVVALPGLPDKGDISDWLASGRTGSELEALVASTKGWTASDPGSPHQAQPIASGATLTRMSDIQSKPVPWLWPGRLPAGMLAVLDGPPGLGKSSAVCDLIARITTGRAWPGSIGTREPRDVVMLGAEDSPEHTIRPRLDAAQADCGRVHLLSQINGRMVRLPEDADAIEKVIASTNAALLVIDPISGYIGNADLHRDNEVRAALTPLVVLAERTGCAVLMLRHLRKAQGGDALSRGLGSVAITALARTGMMLLKDPEDPAGEARILAWPKLSVGPQPPSLRWRFAQTGPDKPPRIDWDSVPCDLSADDILSKQDGGKSRPARTDAATFIRNALAEGPIKTSELEAMASEAGISERTLIRVRAEVGVKATKRPDGWYAEIPKEATAAPLTQ